MNEFAKKHKAIVVGSGFGGLAAAVRLQARGVDVTLVEKREKVGGRAYQFREAGYTFDMGPSLITAPDIIRRIFESAGRRLEDYVELMPMDPFYRIFFHDGSSIDYSGNPVDMKRQMARFDEGDAARYDAFMEAVRLIYGAVIEDGLGSRPFDTIGSMLSFAPRALRLGALKPVSTFAATYFNDFRHRFLFSFHPLFLGGNPFRAPSIYAMIPYLEREQGVWFARGGMYALVEALAGLFIDIGGTIRTNAEVDEIVVRGGKASGVRIGDEVLRADLVVSNADVAHTYRDLIAPGERGRWTDRRVEKMHYSMSCFLLYLGVRRTYPRLAHHTLILSHRYRELVEDVFDRKVLPDDFSMYLHAPTRTDATMAPKGGESLYVLVPVPNLRSGHAWDERAVEQYGDRVLTFLEKWGLDGLRENVEVSRAFTPRDFESELNAFEGNAFGPEPRLTQTAYFRPHNRSEDVEGLYFVGAGTHPGAGVPGVMLSAEATEYCIASDLGWSEVRSEPAAAHARG
ncbi:MAG: phytoene desaturase family protein [Rhodothermales bacterium]